MKGYHPIYAVQNEDSNIQFWFGSRFGSWLFLFVFFVLQSFPFFGVVPAIVDEHGNELEGACEGFLVMKLIIMSYYSSQ